MSNNLNVAPNLMKQSLKAGRPVVGTMIAEIRQPSVVQLLAHAGFDFVIIDNEHGAFNIETVADLSRAARTIGLTPVVRVPDVTYPYIAQSLDAGAQGVMIPRITDVEQVRYAVQVMKYPPVGIRGLALSRGHTNFQSGPMAETMAQFNKETLLIVQVETRPAVEQVDEILAVAGVDVALVGPSDLSIALGIPGQMEAPPMHTAIEAMLAACRRHGVAPAIHMNDLKLAVYWAQQGMQVISSNAETGLMIKGGLEVTSTVKAAFGQ